MEIHWHRRDLRTADNRSLSEASASSQVVPVFVFDPDVLDHAAPPRVEFMLDTLSELRSWYRDNGSDLVTVRGDPKDEIPGLVREYGADRVVWNRDYSGLARRRDDGVREVLNDIEVDHDSFHDAVLHKPGSITTQAGDTYSVYSYFWRKWRDRDKTSPLRTPGADRFASVEAESLPSIDDLGFESPEADGPTGGMSAARERLKDFCDESIYRYETERDTPHLDATSRLSAHLKWGTIGIRTVYDAVSAAKANAPDSEAKESCETFASQLAWREFYAHVLAANPNVVTDNFLSYDHPIEWREDPGGLQAWKDGQTGYPIVDAGMRQLRNEAYMHNRLRMIVASFLTKDLLINWRAGYDWFREKLADHDTANDSGGWQWAASTGTDAQPYFRIFNPMTQGERHDPDAEFIRTYVPELRDAPTDAIHGWTELEPAERDRVAPSYPAPIVDHAARREQALEMFQKARGEN